MITILFSGCQTDSHPILAYWLEDSPSIAGKDAYLSSPFVTAGDRVYLVGHQDGSFPELGWHIPGEMGGIWDHPIKLMDGFDAELILPNDSFRLDQAHTFLNYPMANRHFFSWPERSIEVERLQFVPDGLEGVVVQFIMQNQSSTDYNLTFRFTGHTDLRPTWLGERTHMIDGQDQMTFHQGEQVWIGKDSLNPWHVVYGLNRDEPDYAAASSPYAGKGTSTSLNTQLAIPAGEQVVVNAVISGSLESRSQAMETYKTIRKQLPQLFRAKRDRYADLASRTQITVPDPDLQTTFEWLKYNCDWLVRTVPGIGSGMTAGLPDYPWWFGVDSEYALQGYLMVGQQEVVYETIRLLDSMSKVTNGNGRIIHEMSTNGAVFNPGNVNETPQFATLIRRVYDWTGDREFLDRYFPTIEQGLAWLMKENDADQNLFPDGFGMMEIHGLNSEMIDVAAYTCQAFSDAAYLAEETGRSALANTYQETAEALRTRINERFWSEEFSSYADFIGTDAQALRLIDDAIIRADTLNKPWAVAELRETRSAILANPSSGPRPFVLHHNWVVNTPMEMGIADSDKARRALNTAEQFVNPFGVFVTGIDRDESAGSDEGSFKGSQVFSYTGAVMTLPTGVQAIAENNYGRPDQALDYLRRMTRTFSYALPGSMYEVSPDYGMVCQAWNIYAFAVPVVSQFFGIQPQAARQMIRLQVQMPEAWESARIDKVRIGDNELSVAYYREGETVTIRVNQLASKWTIEFVLPSGAAAVNLNGSPISPAESRITTQGDSIDLTYSRPSSP